MKLKHISILLFIMVISGIALLGHSQVWAANCTVCTPDELSDGTCTMIEGYAVRFQSTSQEACPDYPGESCTKFEYVACSPHTDCADVPTWNYYVTQITAAVALKLGGTEPPGAKQYLPGDKFSNKCPDTTADDGFRFLKMNPSLNCGYGNSVTFSIFIRDCAAVALDRVILASKFGCSESSLNGPGCVNYEVTPVESLCSDRLVVTRDECCGTVTDVSIDGCTAQTKQAYKCKGNPADHYYDTDWIEQNCAPILSAGSGAGEGCWVCSDPPIFLNGVNTYFYQSCDEE